jgi:Kdo2-lipid IVA lauroyltransferase/acyltransferase
MKRNWSEDDGPVDKALYGFIMLLGVLVRSISRSKSTIIAHLIGDFAYQVIKIRRPLVEQNLAFTFPEKNITEIKALARKVYRNQAESLIEMLRLPMIKTAEDAARLMDIDACEFLAKTVERNKGCVMLSAHFGNWELLAHCSGLLVSPITIVVKEVKNHAINRQINLLRTLRGNRIIYDWQALREGLRTLRKGGVLSILGDQSDSSGTFFTEFLGRRASVFLGPAFFALNAGVPLFVAMCRRTGGGRYTVDIEELDTTLLGKERADIEELASRYTKVLERYIYQYPEEWFWLHNRWKNGEERESGG